MTSAASSVRPAVGRSLAILSLAALSFSLMQTAVVPAIGDMASVLHADAQDTTWTLTGYLVSAAVLTPVLGRLGDMYGKRRLVVISLVLFAAGAVLAALGTSLGLVIAGRVLQGAGGGVLPLSFGIVRDEFPAARRPGAIGLLSAVLGVGGGIGLLMGGLLVDHASYRWIFWAGAAMAVIAAVSAQLLLLPESPVRVPEKVDLAGAALLAVVVTAPLIAVSQGRAWGWTSGRTLGLIAAGVVVLAVFALVERRRAAPLVDIPLFVRPPVLMTNLATLLVGFGMFGALVLIPQLAQTPASSGYGFGVDATRAGLLILPGCLIMLVTGPLSGALAERFHAKLPLAFGGLSSAAGLVMLALQHGSQTAVLGWTTVLFVGIGLSFAAIPNLIVEAVPAARTGEATGLNAPVRSVGSSLGTQVVAGILAGSITTARPLPTDHAYTIAFLAGAVGSLVAAVAAAFVPRVRAHDTTGTARVTARTGA
ncbi:MFS transporter [Streptomyces sp. NPDC048484]|uniref:MFS transporter n=1 Tax=Streptomyces sp. NPDC048484 TaxID=3155146 RepID=UPI00341FC63F